MSTPTSKEIAQAVIEEMNNNFKCPNGMTAEDTKAIRELLPVLKECTYIYNKGKWTILLSILGIVMLGMFSSLVWGLWERFLNPVIAKIAGH